MPQTSSRVPKIVITLSAVSLTVQLVGGYAIFKHLHKPLGIRPIVAAALCEIGAFLLLQPFMRFFYRLKNVYLGQFEALGLVFASEGYSHLLPFGDYIVQRVYFKKTKRPHASIVEYIIVLYSYGLLSLVGIYLACQLGAAIFYPNKVTGSLAGKFIYFPFAFTLFFIVLFYLRHSPRLKAGIQARFMKYLGEPAQSPFKIIRSFKLPIWKRTLLVSPMLITWLVEGLGYSFCLRAFGVTAPLLLCFYAYSFVKVFRFVPIFPGGFGEIEAISTLLFSAYGYPVLPIVSGAILFRLLSYWLPLSFGGLSYFALNLHKRVH